VVLQTERPVLRAAPAPLYLLSKLVRDSGFKVVITGEGADEMLAGYDLFREAKIRRFWARQPASTIRPRLLERLYPYLERSPVATREMARAFFGRDLAAWRTPGFSHQPRWQTTAALKRLFSADLRSQTAGARVVETFLGSLPAEFSSWSPLARDQHLEIRTLFSGYLLSSQGDRMLMGHSVEGRFPFLDPAVVALAESFPPEYKLRGLDEKHVLKKVAADLVPPSIVKRSKQPYRVPDAASFVGTDAPGWVADILAPEAVREAGVFDADAVARLWKKCRDHSVAEPFSNADNMAFVGVISTQLLYDRFVRSRPTAASSLELRTHVDRVGASA
jgi:asparagine synthase (glutamine-hydrolysing)